MAWLVSKLLHTSLEECYRCIFQRRRGPFSLGFQEQSECACAIEVLSINMTGWRDDMDSYPMEAALVMEFSTPPAADTCAPIFHRLVTLSGYSSVSMSPVSLPFPFKLTFEDDSISGFDDEHDENSRI